MIEEERVEGEWEKVGKMLSGAASPWCVKN